jgi:hypothetical protein
MNAAQFQKIRLGLLCANIKLGKITMDKYSGPKDPNPENWRTISGAHVHLENGRIDGGAGGKFSGNNWVGKEMHASDPRAQEGDLFGQYGWSVPESKSEREEKEKKKNLEAAVNRYKEMESTGNQRGANEYSEKVYELAREFSPESKEYKETMEAIGWSKEDADEEETLYKQKADQFEKQKAAWERNMAANKKAAKMAEKSDPKSNKNHPYWKTPEGKAEKYFASRSVELEGPGYSNGDKIQSIYEAGGQRVSDLQNKAAAINNEIDKINRKRGALTKEDEARLKELNEKRIPAEREANAWANEFKKWRDQYKPKEKEIFQRTTPEELKQAEEKKTYTPLEAVEELRKRLKARNPAAEKPATEKKTSSAPKKAGNAKTRLEENAKTIGIDLNQYRTDSGRWDKRNLQNIRIDDMPEDKKAAFVKMLKEKGYETRWNGGLGTAIIEKQERKSTAPKPYEFTSAPEGYEDYLKRKQSGQINSYEESQEARRERYENRSAAAAKESNERFARAQEMGSAIPFGQPILVGHHSEKSDRAFRNRLGKQYEKSFEAQKKADYYANKAQSVGTAGISGLDPDAKYKVYEKLNNREKLQEKMQLANHIYRSTPDAEERARKLKEAGFSEKAISAIQQANGVPFASYQITNNSAEIRRLKERMNTMSKEATSSVASESNDLYDMTMSEGRYQFKFEGKPDEAVRSILKKNGFKWSPSRGTWVRQATGNGEYAMKRVQEELKPYVEEATIPQF